MLRLAKLLITLPVLMLPFWGSGTAAHAQAEMTQIDALRQLAKSQAADGRCRILGVSETEELAGYLARAEVAAASRQSLGEVRSAITLGKANFGPYPMSNGITRLESRFLGAPDQLEAAKAKIGQPLEAEQAEELGLVTFAYEDFDWDDQLRVMIEERASHSPDSLTGMEANVRFAGPETMETKIFGRLTAWQTRRHDESA